MSTSWVTDLRHDFVTEFRFTNLDLNAHTSYGVLNWKLAFGEPNPRCQCLENSLCGLPGFFIFRATNAVLMSATLIGTMIDEQVNWKGFGYWFVYYTYWTLAVQVVYLWIAAVSAWKLRLNISAVEPSDAIQRTHTVEVKSLDMPTYIKVQWCLQGILVPATLSVFLLYWSAVNSGTTYFWSPWTHGVNFLVQTVDYVASQQPYFLLHGLYFFGYACIYLVFSVIHFCAGWGNGYGKS